MTYRQDSEIPMPYGGWWIRPEERAKVSPDALAKVDLSYDKTAVLAQKTGFVLWLVSNCNTMSKRELIVEALQQQKIEIDVFGNCASTAANKNYCPKRPDERKCTELYSHYKFFLAFENAICKDYITEKYWSRYDSMSVPIVLQRWVYDRLIPDGSFIAVDDFATPAALADHLRYLDGNDTAYMEYFEWRNKGYDRARDNGPGYRSGFCRACEEVLKDDGRISIIDDAAHWFSDEAHCDQREIDSNESSCNCGSVENASPDNNRPCKIIRSSERITSIPLSTPSSARSPGCSVAVDSAAQAAKQQTMAKLFTPGPLNTSKTVKEAMLEDVGSRDVAFISLTADIRRSLLTIAHADPAAFTAILLQGSGTYAVESVFANALGRQNGKALIISNGAYGDRMAAICKQAGYNHTVIRVEETEPFDLTGIEKALLEGNYTLVAAVHCETSTGQLNRIEDLASLVSRTSEAKFFVDAMASFGAVPISLSDTPIDFLVSSANKCLQGVPGFAFVLAKVSTLESYKGRCTSWSFDLVAQYEALEKTGQFRCTPPTHTMLAFHQALIEHEKEGGVAGRQQRYTENNRVISQGMELMGFHTLLRHQSPYIITSFVYPKDDHFNFENFYARLSKRGQVIYPGKVSSADCFRLGNIGDLWPTDCQTLISHVKEVLHDMGVRVPVVY